MAARYWVGGTGNWNDTAHWAASSGGAGGQTVPGTADDVFLDANSGTGIITTNVAFDVRGLDCTGYAGTLSLTVSSTLRPTLSSTIKFSPTMTITGGATLNIVTTGSNLTTTLQTFGKAPPQLNLLHGTTCKVVLADALTTGVLTLTSGIFDTAGFSINCQAFNTQTSAVRTLTMGASTITVTNTGSCLDWSATTGLTITANTATIIFTGVSPTVVTGGANWNGVSFSFQPSAAGTKTMTANGAGIKNFTYLGPIAKGDLLVFSSVPATPWVLSGTLTLAGNSLVNRPLVSPVNIGAPLTINAAAVSLSNFDFMDVVATGAAAPWTGSSLGDCLGNSGITFTASQARYGVAAGNWSSTATWSASSGGAPGASVPLPQDDVFLDAASGAGTYVMDMPRLCRNLDCTGFTRTLSNGTTDSIYGSLRLEAAMTYNLLNCNLFLRGRGSHTIYSAKAWFYSHTIEAVTGTYTLLSNIPSPGNGALVFNSGTFDANGFDIVLGSFTSVSQRPRTLLMRSGTWTLGAGVGGTIWDCSGPGRLALDAGSSTILLSDASANARTFKGGGLAYNIVRHIPAGSGALTITGDNSFNELDLECTTAKSVLILGGTGGAGCQLVHRALTFKGAAGQTLTVAAGVAGQRCTFVLDEQTLYTVSNATLTEIDVGRSIVATSGGEITDLTRAAGAEGEPIPPEGSYGLFAPATNYLTNGGAETNLSDWQGYQGTNTLLTRETSEHAFGVASFKAVRVAGAPSWGLANVALLNFGTRLPALVVGDKYTLSASIKATPGFVGKNLRALLNIRGGATGAVGVQATFPVGAGWQRYSWTGTVDVADRTGFDIFFIQGDLVDGEGCFFDGIQFEKWPVATPYKHTDGAAATRTAALVQAPAAVLGSPAQFWWACRLRLGFNSNDGVQRRFLSWRDLGSGGGVEISYNTVPTISMGDVIAAGGASGAGMAFGTGHLAGEKHTIVGFATPTQLGVEFDGAPFAKGSRTAFGVPFVPAQTFAIGRFEPSSAQWGDCDYLWVACGKGVLTDADAATLAALGDTCPTRTTLPAAAQTSFIWDALTPAYLAWPFGVGPLGVAEPVLSTRVVEPTLQTAVAEPVLSTRVAEPTVRTGALELVTP